MGKWTIVFAYAVLHFFQILDLTGIILKILAVVRINFEKETNFKYTILKYFSLQLFS